MESLYFRFRQAIGDLVYLATDDARKHECDVTPFVQVTVEILEHGFNSKSTIFNRGRNVWDFIKSVLKEPAIIETVENLTELDPNLRVAVFVKMNLFQQTLTENLNLLYFDDDILDEWYLATAIMRNPEMKTAIIGNSSSCRNYKVIAKT